MNEQTATQTAPKTAATERMSGRPYQVFPCGRCRYHFGYQGGACTLYAVLYFSRPAQTHTNKTQKQGAAHARLC
jgi:hypothetical protein